MGRCGTEWDGVETFAFRINSERDDFWPYTIHIPTEVPSHFQADGLKPPCSL